MSRIIFSSIGETPYTGRQTQNQEKENQCDFTIICSLCNQNIHPHLLTHHKSWHCALKILKYGPQEEPKNIEALVSRRRIVVSHLLKTYWLSHMERQKIDWAYELIKAKITLSSLNTDEDDHHDPCSSPVCLKTVSNPLIEALAICEDRNSTWKSAMEDRYVIIDEFGRMNSSFLGLFDGFHGPFAADAASKELPILILEQLSKDNPSLYKMTSKDHTQLASINKILNTDFRMQDSLLSWETQTEDNSETNKWINIAHINAFIKMDRLLSSGRNEASRIRWSGCTGLTCIIESTMQESIESLSKDYGEELSENELTEQESTSSIGTIHVANAGNIHAVLCRKGKAYCLTQDHSTFNSNERTRIFQAGGTISFNEKQRLVEGLTGATRGLGHHGDPKLKTSVIPIPYTVSVPIDNLCQFLILASSGLWEVLNANEVVSITLQILYSLTKSQNLEQENDQSTNRSPLYDHESTTTSLEKHINIEGSNFEESKDTILENITNADEDKSSSDKSVTMDPEKINVKNSSYFKDSRTMDLENITNAEKETSNLKQSSTMDPEKGSNFEQSRDIDQEKVISVQEGPYFKGFEAMDLTNADEEISNSKESSAMYIEKINMQGGSSITNSDEEISNSKASRATYLENIKMQEGSRSNESRATGLTSSFKQSRAMDPEKITNAQESNSGVSETNLTAETAQLVLPPQITNEQQSSEIPLYNDQEQTLDNNNQDSKQPNYNYYEKAAISISKQLVHNAMLAGSKENTTVLVVLLQGCKELPQL
nr:PREDICTED: protein phosphatase 2C-like domain-containing protein 1 [Latimeria chalumnae]XP_014344989.1 PREDICTED: protein phosphatase 2C-like domain-containing protein 1 [Latimeria chalumnae]|eukprot:XP_014344988.1 PREDICTED: protein phosphatase 2C-like domain-containing protein 1 [Latimeria chalumnae]